MRKTSLSTVFLFICAQLAFCDDSELFKQYITETQYAALLQNGEINRTVLNDPTLALVPKIVDKDAIVASVRQMNPAIVAEVLLLHPMKSREPNVRASAEKIHATVLKVNTLKGIEYWSASRKQMRVFINDAFVTDTADSRKKLPDPAFVPSDLDLSLFAFLQDSSFGDYSCSIRYRFHDDSISMDMENTTTIWVFFIPAVDPGHLRSYLYILPGTDSILFYGFGCVNIVNLFGLVESKRDSLYNRVKAMYAWFLSQYDGTVLTLDNPK
jgi:hypothetical protein